MMIAPQVYASTAVKDVFKCMSCEAKGGDLIAFQKANRQAIY
jgi:hypothetical protein